MDRARGRARRAGRVVRHRFGREGIQRRPVAHLPARSESVRVGRAVPGVEIPGAVCRACRQLHADQDTVNPIEASQKMAAAAKAAGVDTEYATVPGGTHLEAYLTYASQIF